MAIVTGGDKIVRQIKLNVRNSMRDHARSRNKCFIPDWIRLANLRLRDQRVREIREARNPYYGHLFDNLSVAYRDMIKVKYTGLG